MIEPGAGQPKVEMVADGKLVAESTAYADFGFVVVDWTLPDAPQREGEEEKVMEKEKKKAMPKTGGL
jgi:hypothetical protein